MPTLEEIVQAALGAPEERKVAALRVLRGEAAEKDEGRRLKDEVEPFVSLREVSRRLGISTCSLWRYGVPGHSFAGRARFRMSEIEAHLRELEEGRRTAKGAKEREGMKGRRERMKDEGCGNGTTEGHGRHGREAGVRGGPAGRGLPAGSG